MDLTEDLLKEVNRGLQKDVENQLDKVFEKLLSSHSNRDIRFGIIINSYYARFNFNIWLNIKQNDKQEIFDLIKNYLKKQYGFNLVNQRLYMYYVMMEFNDEERIVDPFETYTLLKINQMI